ncbi:MAG: Fe-S protein assembly co-chaperone HscB [Pseudomonadota bacterium]
MSLQANDFELFDVPVRFAQDRAQLDTRWKALQREAHPDRFAADGAAAKRVAMQWSVRINEAYQRLKDPLKRAAYLCELQGVPVQAENNTAMPAAFLMQQMAWRESLEETDSTAALEALADEVLGVQRQVQQELAHLLDEVQDPAQAVGQVRALMFVERFLQEVNAKLDRLT